MKPEYKMIDPLLKAYLSADMYGYVKKTKPALVVSPSIWQSAVILLVSILGIVGIVLFSSCGLRPVRAEMIDYSNEQIANAIYYAEGGAKTKHPYGILAHYKTTTPRQACLNTIAHARRDFKGGDFIVFLGNRYCPVGCENDNGTNRFWIRNVNFYLQKGQG